VKRSTLVRSAIPATFALTIGLAGCGASNEPSGGGASSAAAGVSAPAVVSSAADSAGTSPSEAPSSDASAPSSAAPGGGGDLSGTLKGAGSSAQTAAMQAWAAGFQAANPGANVQYAPVGSGAGVKNFIAGAVTFAGSDKFLTADQLKSAQAQCKSPALDIPTYVSPIAVVYNLPSVKDLQLSPKTLASIFRGKISTWNDPAIKADNPSASLPSTKVTPVHRSDKSGTTNNFTDYLNKAAPDVWTDAAAEDWPVAGGESAKGTSGVVQAVSGGEGTIGYADDSQAGTLGKAKVKVGSGFSGPSADGAAKTLSESPTVTGRPDGDLAVNINRTPKTDGAYPVLLVSYEIFCTKYPDAGQANLVSGMLKYIVSAEGQQGAAKNAGSAPLPDSLVTKAQASIAMIASGG